MQVGFVGLGNMGLPMACNLLAAGHTVRGFDTAAPALSAFSDAGGLTVTSIAAVAEGSEVVITMLPNGAILQAVYDELVPATATGSCLLDCSTVDVQSAREAHARADAAGLVSLDAPVSGGVGGAAAGTLTFMVGGADEALTLAAPLLDIMGGKTVHCGGPGTGQAAKICNNMLLGISMIGTCEAINLADQLGLERQKFFDVASAASGQCWSLNTYCPMPGVGPMTPADNDYQPGFAAALMDKDLGLSQVAAEQAGALTPLGAHAAQLYRQMVEDGQGGLDFSAVLLRLAEGRA